MKKIKNFETFNENLSKISHYLNSLRKKGGEIASEVWEIAKIEKEETKISINILSKMIKGQQVSDKEKIFLKRQSGDLIKILPLIAIQGIPIPIPITPLLIILGRKYGFDFLPKDHRSILNNEIELPEDIKSQLLDIPETGMGYHIVNIVLDNGRVLHDRTILNGSKLVLNIDEELDVYQIDGIAT